MKMLCFVAVLYCFGLNSQNNFAVQFPNSNSGVNVGNSPLFDIYDASSLRKTFLFWAKETNASQFRTNIMMKSTCNGSFCNDYHFFLTGSSNQGIVLGIGDANQSGCNHNIEPLIIDQKWHFYAISLEGLTPDSGVKTVYYDGQIINQCTFNDNAPVNTDDLYFGYYSGSLPLEINSIDFMDDISIWNDVLTQSEIQNYMICPPMGDEDDLVGFWNFEEQSGMALDQSIYGNDGDLFSGAIRTTDTPMYNCTLGLNQTSLSKKLLKIIDLMGRETRFKPNTTLIYVYDDGSTEKVFSVRE